MVEQVKRPLTEGVGIKPTTEKPTMPDLGRSLTGARPASQKPVPTQSSPAGDNAPVPQKKG